MNYDHLFLRQQRHQYKPSNAATFFGEMHTFQIVISGMNRQQNLKKTPLFFFSSFNMTSLRSSCTEGHPRTPEGGGGGGVGPKSSVPGHSLTREGEGRGAVSAGAPVLFAADRGGRAGFGRRRAAGDLAGFAV